jgi:hypothetical protein
MVRDDVSGASIRERDRGAGRADPGGRADGGQRGAGTIARDGTGEVPSGDRYRHDHGGLENFCWAIQGDQWYARPFRTTTT